MSLFVKKFWKALVVAGQWDYENKSNLRQYLDNDELPGIIEKINEAVIIVLGWDGTMQNTIDTFRGKWLPFLGINFGSRGYLLHPQNIMHSAQNFTRKDYPLLEAQVDLDGKESRYYAFGDVYIKPRNSLGVCQYDLKLNWSDGTCAVSGVIGDGIVISSPAGSTGYTKNAGWPVLPHGSNNLIVTHISPNRTWWLSPIVIPDDSAVTMNICDNARRPVLVATDGRPIADSSWYANVSVRVRKSSELVTLLIADTHLENWNTQAFLELGYTS